MHLQELPSTFHAVTGHSVNFHQFSAVPSVRFYLLSVNPRNHASTFRPPTGPSIKRSYVCRSFRELPSTLRASTGTPSTCVNFSCISGTFSQLSVHPWDFQSASVNSQCIRGTMRQIFISGTFSHLQYTFRVAVGPSINLRQLFVHQWDIQSTFRSSVVPSVNFGQLSVYLWYLPSTSVNNLCIRGTSQNVPCSCWSFRQLQSTFRAASGPYVNFLCIRGIFHQLSVQPRDLSSTFCVARGPSVNFSQLSMPPWGLRSTFHVAAALSVNIHCGWRTIRQLFLRSWDSPSTSVNVLYVRGILRQFYMRP